MDPHLTELLDSLFERGRAHDSQMRDRLERYRNVEPDSASLLAVDNVLSHQDEVADFRSLVDRDERVTSALAATGAGVLLITKN